MPLWRPGGLCPPFPSFRGNVNATKGPAGGPCLVWFWSKIQPQHGTPQHFSFKTSRLCRTFPPGCIRSPRHWSEVQGPRPQDSRPPTCSPGWARTTVDRDPPPTHTHTGSGQGGPSFTPLTPSSGHPQGQSAQCRGPEGGPWTVALGGPAMAFSLRRPLGPSLSQKLRFIAFLSCTR